MNAVLKVIAQRHSCRAFTGRMPTDEALNAVALAAIQSPSGMNRQKWHVAVVKNRALIDEMEQVGMDALKAMEDQSGYERIMSRGGTLFYHAPCMVVVGIEPGTELDCGILCQNVTLAAESAGLNTLICGMARLCFTDKTTQRFSDQLGFPEGYAFGIAVLLGYAAQPGEPHPVDWSKVTVVE